MKLIGLSSGASLPCLAIALVALAAPAHGQTTAAPPAGGTPQATGNAPVGGDASAASTQAAQTPGSPGEAAANSSADIIVTAQRRSERLSRVGVSVAAVSSDQLRQLDVRQAFDLARVVPGFQASFSASGGAPNYYLRGVGFNTQNANSTAPVGVYVDEVAYAYPYMSLGVSFDLERVEVLKGPQGTFYGRNTTGGLVDFVTAKPTSTFQGSLTAGYGNFGRWETSGFVSGPISDNLKARIAYDSDNRGTWQYSITRKDRLGRRHQNAVRGTVAWDPGSKLHFLGSGTYWKRTGDTQAPQAIAQIIGTPDAKVAASLQPKPRNNQAADWTPDSDQPQSDITGIIRPPLRINSDFYAFALRSTYDVSDTVSIVSLTGYSRLKHAEVVDSAGVQTEQVIQGNYGRIKSFSEELRLVGQGPRFNWSIGGYYARDKTQERTLGYAGELPTILGLRAFALSIPQTEYTPEQLASSYRLYASFGNTDDRVASAFANAEYAFTPKFKLALGARYTNDRLSYLGAGVDTNGNNVPLINTVFPVLLGTPVRVVENGSFSLNPTNTGFAFADQTQKKSNVAWRANLTYTPTSNLLFYGQVSRGYKSGSFPVLAASTVTQLAPVVQEKLTAYEGGVKFTQGPIQLNASAYYYDYRNRQVYGQVPDLIFTALPRIVNVPKSRVYGVEGDATWRIERTLTVRAAAAYLNAKIQRYQGFNELAQPTNFAGTPFPFAPKFQGSGSVNKDFPLNDHLILETAADGTYQAKSFSYIGALDLFRIKAYGLVGASISLHDTRRGLRLTGYVRNLFDTYYWTSAQIGHDTAIRIAGMPRTYGIRGTWNF